MKDLDARMFEGFESDVFDHDGGSLFFRKAGAGPPLLLLHGFPQTHVCWHAVAPRLHDYTVVCPDLPGYGGSQVTVGPQDASPFSKRAMAAVMVQLMTSLGFPHFALAGHDRGGRVAYRLALDHPHAVHALAVLDIIPTLDMWETFDAELALADFHWPLLAQPAPIPERLFAREHDFLVTTWLDRWARFPERITQEARIEYLDAFRDEDVRRAAIEDYRAGAGVDREHDAQDRRAGRRIECPVLALWSGKSTTPEGRDPLTVWRNWADRVEGHALPVGHFLAEEAPEEVTGALHDFLQRAS